MHEGIRSYLAELSSALRVSASSRRRILAECADHLEELVADERERGCDAALAVRRAVSRFGAPATLAEEFNADAARHGLDRASRALAISTAAAVVAAGLSLHPGVAARPWPSGEVFSLAMQLWVQVPAACGAIALFLAVVAPWLRGRPLVGRPAELAGRSLATTSISMLPVAVVAAANLGTDATLAERLWLAIVACSAPVAMVWGLRAASRARWLAHPAEDSDVLDVIAAVAATLAGRSAFADRWFRAAGATWATARARAPRATRWLDLRRHPWRAAACMSVAAGLALTAPDLLIGDPDFPAAAIEAVAVYVCFATLGALLGLRGKPAYATTSDAKAAVTT